MGRSQTPWKNSPEAQQIKAVGIGANRKASVWSVVGTHLQSYSRSRADTSAQSPTCWCLRRTSSIHHVLGQPDPHTPCFHRAFLELNHSSLVRPRLGSMVHRAFSGPCLPCCFWNRIFLLSSGPWMCLLQSSLIRQQQQS